MILKPEENEEKVDHIVNEGVKEARRPSRRSM